MTWIDAQPRVAARGADAMRPRSSAGGRCSTIRRARLRDLPRGRDVHQQPTVDVGTGGAFQVPSLVGIGSRGPFMHDGCAKTLADRFSNTACGGANHGKISGLSANEIADMITYLQSI